MGQQSVTYIVVIIGEKKRRLMSQFRCTNHHERRVRKCVLSVDRDEEESDSRDTCWLVGVGPVSWRIHSRVVTLPDIT
jgi:hypothetical protein